MHLRNRKGKSLPWEVQFRVMITSVVAGTREGGLGRVEARVMTLIGISLEAVLEKGHSEANVEMRTEIQIYVERIIRL